jgi:chromosome segregation ATPase
MEKPITVAPFIKTPRMLNDVQFASVIHALTEGTFDVKAMVGEPVSQSLREFDYTFNKCGDIVVGQRSIKEFLHDVVATSDENAHYERTETGLHKANREFSDENHRLNARISVLDNGNQFLRDRCDRLQNEANQLYQDGKELQNQLKSVTASHATIAAELAARERNAESFRAEIADNERRLANQGISIGNYQDTMAKQDKVIATLEQIIKIMRERTIGFQDELSAALKERDALTRALAAQPDLKSAEEGEDLRSEVSRLNGLLNASNANFKMADHALSCRNETIAAMDRLAKTRETEYEADMKALRQHIAGLQKSNAILSKNLADAAYEVVNARRESGRKPVNLSFAIFPDGSVGIKTEALVSMSEHNVQIVGEVSNG